MSFSNEGVKTKGIILAGGSGTRLYPATQVISKQLLPVYDKPMIYYPLSCLMLAGITDIQIISTPHDLPLFKKLLGTGSQWGIKLRYCEQPSPDGLAQAFLLSEEFLGNDPSCLVLGDNIFYGSGLSILLQKISRKVNNENGATVFAYRVRDPERYGVVEFNENMKAIGLEEKPTQPKSSYAVTGLYFYDSNVVSLAKTLKPSKRGELEITDLNRLYLEMNKLSVEILGRGHAWLDTGTSDSLLDAANYIKAIESRQGQKIACLEEIAYLQGWIDKETILVTADKLGKNQYGLYLKDVIKQKLK